MGELVAAVKGGDWAAFEVLYFRHKDWVYRLAWRFCGDETEALDVVQEVFVYLAGKMRGIFGWPVALTTFLYPAVKHTALALKKKRRRMGARGGEEQGVEIDVAATEEKGDARGELAGSDARVGAALSIGRWC